MLARSAKWLLLTLSSLALASDQPTSDSVHASAQKQGINWTPCPHPGRVQLECATLAVPLNYTAGASSETIDLQLTKVNALKQPSKGSILFNPGGPGHTGRDMIRGGDFGLAALLMTGGDHDLIAFNPRGTGNTIPFSCNMTIDQDDAPANLKDDLEESLWIMYEDAAGRCSKEIGNNGKLIGTTFVARDVMQVVDALNEDGLLRYWGMSYGTVLGATIAAMFPDRMDKVVLDGVVNLAEYWAGEPISAYVDTEATIDGFFSECVESLERCKLASDGSSASDLRQKFDQFVKESQTIGDDGMLSPYALELPKLVANDLGSTMHWPDLADSLAPLFENQPQSQAGGLGPEDLSPDLLGDDAPLFGIRCGDSKFRAHELSDLTPMLLKIKEIAPTLGPVQGSMLTVCGAWQMAAEERFTDPLENIQTRNPILFVGNTFDPRTPLASARNASAVFPGSGLLTLNGYGHCSPAHPSLCVGKAIRNYFANGVLPAEGTVCEPSMPPFYNDGLPDLLSTEAHLLMDSDEALLAAWTHMGQQLSRAHGLL